MFIRMEDIEKEIKEKRVRKLKEAIYKNEKYREDLLKRMELLKQIESETKEEKETHVMDSSSIETSFFSPIDVSHYIKKILSCIDYDDEDLYDYVKEILPNICENYNYKQIINMILIKLYIEKNDWKQLAREEEDPKEVEIYLNMIQNIQKIIDTVFMIRDEKVEDFYEVEPNNNKLIFLTKGKNVCFLEDIESINSKEYQQRLQKIIEEIKDNSFWYRNYKRFHSTNKKQTTLIEVKGFKIRVLIDQIDANTFVIIGTFMKKTSWNKEVSLWIQNRFDYYKSQREKIFTYYKNDDGTYQKQNDQILEAYEQKIEEYQKRKR